MKSTALAIVCTPRYEPGLIVLLDSLTRNGDVPWGDVEIILLAPERLSDSLHTFAKENDIQIVPCRNEDYAEAARHAKQPRFETAWCKFDAWLLPHRKVVVMDADLLCLGSVADLFDEDVFSGHDVWMAPDHGIHPAQHIGGHMVMNSGVIVLNTVFEKRKLDRADLIRAGENGLSFDGGDMGALHALSRLNVGRLPHRYNFSKRIFVHDKTKWDKYADTIRLLHYTGKKPWDSAEPGYDELTDLWKEHAGKTGWRETQNDHS